MVEVKLSITAEDRASSAFKSAEGSVGSFGHACDLAKGRVADFMKGLIGFEALRIVAWKSSSH
jgi:hypothetical protein